jgi:hypothetical protein
MSAPRLIARILIATVTAIAVGTILVLGFTVLEPFEAEFGTPPASLGWGDIGGTIIAMTAAAGLGLLLLLVIWFVAAPIRRDKRQQFRR